MRGSKLLTMFSILLTVMLQVRGIELYRKDAANAYNNCASFITEDKEFQNFQEVIDYYVVIFNSIFALDSKIYQNPNKKVLLAVSDNLTQGTMNTYITNTVGGYESEFSDEDKSKIFFMLTGAANLLAIYDPSTKKLKSYQLQSVCRSFMPMLTTFVLYDQWYKELYKPFISNKDKPKDVKKRFVASVAGFLSNVVLEDSMAINDREVLTFNYFKNFKANWHYFRNNFKSDSPLFLEMDGIVNADFPELTQNGWPNMKELNVKIANLIYERAFHQAVPSDFQEFFNFNLKSVFLKVTKRSLGSQFEYYFRKLDVEIRDETEDEEEVFMKKEFDVLNNEIIKTLNNNDYHLVALSRVLSFCTHDAFSYLTLSPEMFNLLMIERYMLAATPENKYNRYKMLSSSYDISSTKELMKSFISFIFDYFNYENRVYWDTLKDFRDELTGLGLDKIPQKENRISEYMEWLNEFLDEVERPVGIFNFEPKDSSTAYMDYIISLRRNQEVFKNYIENKLTADQSDPFIVIAEAKLKANKEEMEIDVRVII